MSKISIIIPTYNGFPYLQQCINVLRVYDIPQCEFIVVDNESTDGTKEWLATQTSIIVVNGKNTWGIAKSYNKGREKAKGNYLLFMHNDVVCTKEVVPALLETLKKDDVAAAGPFTNRCMYYKQFVNAETYQTLDELQEYAFKFSNHGKDIFVDACLFLESFCLMVRAEVFDEVGGFDERFKCSGYEGVDLSFKLTKAGHWLCTTTVYAHHGDGSVDVKGQASRDGQEIEKRVFNQKWGFDLSYSSAVRHELLKYLDIKRPGVSVFELGCALGGNLMYIKWLNRSAQLTAVELNTSAAAIAKNYGDISVMDVEEIDFDALEGKFDYVIAGDLIEHLKNPWSLVKNLAKVLKPNGIIAVSIPNVAHVSNVYNLLNGLWNYKDAGLLDRTHLRFFTRDSMIRMFDEAGFKIEACEYLKLPLTEKMERFIDDLISLPATSISRVDLEAFQIFIKAGKKNIF